MRRDIRNSRAMNSTEHKSSLLVDVPINLQSNKTSSLKTVLQGMKEPPAPINKIIIQKYDNKHISYEYLTLCKNYFDKKIEHSEFCEKLFVYFQNRLNTDCEIDGDIRSFLFKRVVTLREVLEEHGKLDETILSVFSLLEFLIEKISFSANSENAKLWLSSRIGDILNQMFYNSKTLIIESVFL